MPRRESRETDATPPAAGDLLAFTGFPMNARDPMTYRADVAAYRLVWRNEKVIAVLMLDRAGWPGSSGSHVFISEGRVIGILTAARAEERTEMTTLRQSRLFTPCFWTHQ